jgi:hypothetical protein
MKYQFQSRLNHLNQRATLDLERVATRMSRRNQRKFLHSRLSSQNFGNINASSSEIYI